jgi:hypothetical protein
MTPICSIEGCKAHAAAKGLCSKHYMRTRRHGDPNQVKPPGAPRDVELNALKAKLREEVGPLVSERTFARYYVAMRYLERLSLTPEDIEEIRELATRPNGSFNVSRFVAVTADLVTHLMGAFADGSFAAALGTSLGTEARNKFEAALREEGLLKRKRGRPPNRDNQKLLEIVDEADRTGTSRRRLLRAFFKDVRGRDATEEDVARSEAQIWKLRRQKRS